MSKKLSPILIFTISTVLFGVAVSGSSQVHQNGFMKVHKSQSFCHTENCGEPFEDPLCASLCLNNFENSLLTLPIDSVKLALVVFSILLLVSQIFAVHKIIVYSLKSFVRKRRESFLLSFFNQIGNWLILFGKRDPALVFAFA